MKYLGVDINKYTNHINSRRTATNHTMAKLINQDIIQAAIHPGCYSNLPGYLYKMQAIDAGQKS